MAISKAMEEVLSMVMTRKTGCITTRATSGMVMRPSREYDAAQELEKMGFVRLINSMSYNVYMVHPIE